MFDTHCHLNFQSFKNNLNDVIKRARNVGVSHITIPSTDVNTSIDAVEIAQNNNNIYSAVGIHPHHIFKFQIPHPRHPRENGDPEQDWIPDPHFAKLRVARQVGNDVFLFINSELKEIKKLAKEKSVVAIGEIGLDRHYYSKTKYRDYQINEDFLSLQKDFFIKQIEIAAEFKKSLILHNREASDEFLEIFDKSWREEFKEQAVFNCCEPKKKLLDYAIAKKIFIGVDGDVTYSKQKEEFVKQIPLESLVLETDSPFLTPEPIRSTVKFPNEPKNIQTIAEFIAKIKGVKLDDFKKTTFENSKKLFNLN